VQFYACMLSQITNNLKNFSNDVRDFNQTLIVQQTGPTFYLNFYAPFSGELPKTWTLLVKLIITLILF